MFLKAIILASLLLGIAVDVAVGSDVDVEQSVARLDYIASVYDPEVEEVAALGPAAVPYLIDRLTSPNRLTALGSVWALKHMADEDTLIPILENWAACELAETKTAAAEALHAVVRAKRGDWEACTEDSLDSRLSSLLQAVFCPAPGANSRFAIQGAAGDPPIRVYAAGIASSEALGCIETEFELVGADDVYYGPAGQRFVRLDCMIQQVPPTREPMGSTKALWGARPEAVAVVQIIRGTQGRGDSGGGGSAWVLAGGVWHYVAALYGMMFD